MTNYIFKIDFSRINKEELKDEITYLSDRLNHSFHGKRRTAIDAIGDFPFFPQFLISALEAIDEDHSRLEAVEFDKKTPAVTYDEKANAERNTLVISATNVSDICEYMTRKFSTGSNLENIAIQYFDYITKSERSDSIHNAMCEIAYNVEVKRVTEARFNKVERQFTEQFLAFIR